MKMRGHSAHMWICGAMIAAALVVVAVTGNAVVLLPAIGCLAMMAMMMWMMGRTMGGGAHSGSSDGPHEKR